MAAEGAFALSHREAVHFMRFAATCLARSGPNRSVVLARTQIPVPDVFEGGATAARIRSFVVAAGFAAPPARIVEHALRDSPHWELASGERPARWICTRWKKGDDKMDELTALRGMVPEIEREERRQDLDEAIEGPKPVDGSTEDRLRRLERSLEVERDRNDKLAAAFEKLRGEVLALAADAAELKDADRQIADAVRALSRRLEDGRGPPVRGKRVEWVKPTPLLDRILMQLRIWRGK